MSTHLTKTMFEQTLNTKFSLFDNGQEPLSMNLIELSDGHSSARQEQFALRFRGDRDRILPQSIYPMRHDAIGDFDLFLVPIGQDETGTIYEAVFNRLIKTQDQAQ